MFVNKTKLAFFLFHRGKSKSTLSEYSVYITVVVRVQYLNFKYMFQDGLGVSESPKRL